MEALISEGEKIIRLNSKGFENYSRWHETKILGVSITGFKDNKITIKGREEIIKYNNVYDRVSIGDVEEKYIIDKRFLWWSWREVKDGWVVLKNKPLFNKTFVNFRIIQNLTKEMED